MTGTTRFSALCSKFVNLKVGNAGINDRNYCLMLYDVVTYSALCRDVLYEVVQPALNLVNEDSVNGTYLGIIGQLFNKTADIYPYPVAVRHSRHEVADFSSIIGIYSINFIIKQIEKTPDWQAIFEPFSLHVWLAVGITFILVALVLPIIINYELNKNGNEHLWTKMRSFWFLFSSFTNQGSDISYINRLVSRSFIGICIISILILTFGYSGTLTSYLTAPVPEPVPRTFEELSIAVKNGKCSCSTHLNQDVTKLVMNSKSEFMKDIKTHMITNNNFFRSSDIKKQVMKARSAFISVKYLLSWMAKYYPGQWYICDDSLTILISALPMRKGFPFKKDVDFIVRQLFETGLMTTVYPDIVYNIQKMENQIMPLDLNNFLGVAILLIAGYTLSIICFVVELFLGKKSKVLPDRNNA
ncbi:glutamate receptor ionotropic, delta-2-like [Centruroides sculpturatus]|uniref:glutamate receptor ionotropic, delta-2-like n=1 Tax=Centruroides sculpturatus TaxID=218467 RepID=UPI000C6E1D28|nr:glutamate receptor ionotropic, delta-2-like [Centruroides sculpturatus]